MIPIVKSYDDIDEVAVIASRIFGVPFTVCQRIVYNVINDYYPQDLSEDEVLRIMSHMDLGPFADNSAYNNIMKDDASSSAAGTGSTGSSGTRSAAITKALSTGSFTGSSGATIKTGSTPISGTTTTKTTGGGGGGSSTTQPQLVPVTPVTPTLAGTSSIGGKVTTPLGLPKTGFLTTGSPQNLGKAEFVSDQYGNLKQISGAPTQTIGQIQTVKDYLGGTSFTGTPGTSATTNLGGGVKLVQTSLSGELGSGDVQTKIIGGIQTPDVLKTLEQPLAPTLFGPSIKTFSGMEATKQPLGGASFTNIFDTSKPIYGPGSKSIDEIKLLQDIGGFSLLTPSRGRDFSEFTGTTVSPEMLAGFNFGTGRGTTLNPETIKLLSIADYEKRKTMPGIEFEKIYRGFGGPSIELPQRIIPNTTVIPETVKIDKQIDKLKFEQNVRGVDNSQEIQRLEDEKIKSMLLTRSYEKPLKEQVTTGFSSIGNVFGDTASTIATTIGLSKPSTNIGISTPMTVEEIQQREKGLGAEKTLTESPWSSIMTFPKRTGNILNILGLKAEERTKGDVQAYKKEAALTQAKLMEEKLSESNQMVKNALDLINKENEIYEKSLSPYSFRWIDKYGNEVSKSDMLKLYGNEISNNINITNPNFSKLMETGGLRKEYILPSDEDVATVKIAEENINALNQKYTNLLEQNQNLYGDYLKSFNTYKNYLKENAPLAYKNLKFVADKYGEDSPQYANTIRQTLFSGGIEKIVEGALLNKLFNALGRVTTKGINIFSSAGTKGSLTRAVGKFDAATLKYGLPLAIGGAVIKGVIDEKEAAKQQFELMGLSPEQGKLFGQQKAIIDFIGLTGGAAPEVINRIVGFQPVRTPIVSKTSTGGFKAGSLYSMTYQSPIAIKGTRPSWTLGSISVETPYTLGGTQWKLNELSLGKPKLDWVNVPSSSADLGKVAGVKQKFQTWEDPNSPGHFKFGFKPEQIKVWQASPTPTSETARQITQTLTGRNPDVAKMKAWQAVQEEVMRQQGVELPGKFKFSLDDVKNLPKDLTQSERTLFEKYLTGVGKSTRSLGAAATDTGYEEFGGSTVSGIKKGADIDIVGRKGILPGRDVLVEQLNAARTAEGLTPRWRANDAYLEYIAPGYVKGVKRMSWKELMNTLSPDIPSTQLQGEPKALMGIEDSSQTKMGLLTKGGTQETNVMAPKLSRLVRDWGYTTFNIPMQTAEGKTYMGGFPGRQKDLPKLFQGLKKMEGISGRGTDIEGLKIKLQEAFPGRDFTTPLLQNEITLGSSLTKPSRSLFTWPVSSTSISETSKPMSSTSISETSKPMSILTSQEAESKIASMIGLKEEAIMKSTKPTSSDSAKPSYYPSTSYYTKSSYTSSKPIEEPSFVDDSDGSKKSGDSGSSGGSSSSGGGGGSYSGSSSFSSSESSSTSNVFENILRGMTYPGGFGQLGFGQDRYKSGKGVSEFLVYNPIRNLGAEFFADNMGGMGGNIGMDNYAYNKKQMPQFKNKHFGNKQMLHFGNKMFSTKKINMRKKISKWL